MVTSQRVCCEAGCERPHVARGFCHRHYRAFLKAGGARKVVMERHYGKTPEERFWLYTNQAARGCWEWTGYKNDKGYGVLNLGGERILAHRFAYKLVAEIPDGMFVLHRCDNPGCVRVKHLFLGTKADNNADMTAKGRARRGTNMDGTDNHQAKLNEADVRAIRASQESGPVLSRRYGVTNTTIWGIRKRLIWKHIE